MASFRWERSEGKHGETALHLAVWFPVKRPQTPTERKLAERMIESVRAIMDAKTNLRDANLSDRHRGSLKYAVEAHERRIDEAVLRLYEVERIPE